MRRNSNYKVIFLSLIILFSILSISIGYSAFTSKLSIGKIATGVRIKKDVRITDLSLMNESSHDFFLSDMNYNIDSVVTDVTFNNTSSYVTFKATISNIGNQETGIYAINVPEGIGYEISNYNLKDKLCDNSSRCSLGISKDINIKIYPVSDAVLGARNITIDFDFRGFNKITYTDINVDNTYPTEVINGGDLNITFTENLKNISILSNGIEINKYNQITRGQTITVPNVTNDIEIKREFPVRIVSGSGTQLGDELCIKDECFYLISSTVEKLTMLSKYNLYVGNSVSENGNVTSLASPTGIQNSKARGYVEGQYPFIGTTAYSSAEQKGINYNDYSGSIVERYVNNYSSYLNTLGVVPITSRLISYTELISLGCSENGWSCAGAPSWVYATSYWSGSAGITDCIWYVGNTKNFDDISYNITNIFGVRPVIEIERDLLAPL